jgi:hypothetical protein
MEGKRNLRTAMGIVIMSFACIVAGSGTSLAHCDTLDGPVVKAARNALETGDVRLVLLWVQKKDEAELTKAFERTLHVRKLNDQAKELADLCFFETLVRIHRAGEGAPYTGLKSAGLDLGPAVPAADRALETGTAEPLLKFLQDTVKDGVHRSFTKAVMLKNYKNGDVEAGREYIEAYVPFVHYIERLYEASKYPAKGHYPEPEETGGHAHKGHQ